MGLIKDSGDGINLNVIFQCLSWVCKTSITLITDLYLSLLTGKVHVTP